MNKKVPLWFVLLLCWFSFIITIIFGWAVWHITTTNTKIFNKKTSDVIISIASFPSLVYESYLSLIHPYKLVRENIYPDIQGFKVEKNYVDSNFVLLSTYDYKIKQPVAKLIRLSDQKVLHQWTPDFNKIEKSLHDKERLPQRFNKTRLRIYHPLLSSDGSIIFNDQESHLIKIDKDSKLVWFLNRNFNHSLEYDTDGNIWTQSVIEHSRFLPDILKGFIDNGIAKISPWGKLIFEKSIAQILVENGYRGILLGGINEMDLVHLNDIQPALTSSKYWLKGDLLISLRHKSTVLLYRPSTDKIIWLKTGPWLNQHDVDFIDSTHIGVFGNNIIRYNLKGTEENIWSETLLNGYNQEYTYDFKTDKIDTPYTEFLKKAKVSTFSEGRSDILPNGDIFIEETNNNRLLRGTKKDIVWQYVDRIDDHSVAALGWSRYITKEEFKKLTFLKK